MTRPGLSLMALLLACGPQMGDGENSSAPGESAGGDTGGGDDGGASAEGPSGPGDGDGDGGGDMGDGDGGDTGSPAQCQPEPGQGCGPPGPADLTFEIDGIEPEPGRMARCVVATNKVDKVGDDGQLQVLALVCSDHGDDRNAQLELFSASPAFEIPVERGQRVGLEFTVERRDDATDLWLRLVDANDRLIFAVVHAAFLRPFQSDFDWIAPLRLSAAQDAYCEGAFDSDACQVDRRVGLEFDIGSEQVLVFDGHSAAAGQYAISVREAVEVACSVPSAGGQTCPENPPDSYVAAIVAAP